MCYYLFNMRNHEWELVGKVVIDNEEACQEVVDSGMTYQEKYGFRVSLSNFTKLDKEMLEVCIEVPESRLTGTSLTVVGKNGIQIRFIGFNQGERTSILMMTALNEIGQGIGIIDGDDSAKVTLTA